MTFKHPIPSSLQITLAGAKRSSVSSGDWFNRTFSLQQLQDVLTTHRTGEKEGQCILQGSVMAQTRTKSTMVKIPIIVIDVDNGTSVELIKQKVKSTGLYCIWHTTHSHLKTTTEVKRDDWVRFTENNEDPTLYNYLVKEKRYIDEIARTAEIVNEFAETPGGFKVIIEHDPMEKSRWLFMLSKPWELKNYKNARDAENAWKDAYRNFASYIGVVFDKSCVDPCRLFYLPRHSVGAAYDSGVIDGEAIDIFALPRPKEDAFLAAGRSLSGDRSSVGQPEDELKSLLRQWMKLFGNKFQIVDALEYHCPEVFIRSTSDTDTKKHITCPFENEHTSQSPSSTFVTNAGEGTAGDTFVIHCCHSCNSRYDKLDFLAQMIRNEWFTVETLTNREFHCIIDEEDVGEETVTIPPDCILSIDDVVDVETADRYIKGLAYSGKTSLTALSQIKTVFHKLSGDAGMQKLMTTAFKSYEKDYNKCLKDIAKRQKQREKDAATAKGAYDRDVDAYMRKLATLSERRDDEGKKVVFINSDFRNNIKTCLNELRKSNDINPRFFMFSSFCRVYKDDTTFLPKIEHFSSSTLRHELSKVVRFVQGDGSDTESVMIEIPPPREIIEDILSDREIAFPRLAGISSTPIYGPDGELRTINGFDISSGMYLSLTPGLDIPDVPDEPTEEDVEQAKDLLINQILYDFPFDGPLDGDCERAHMLCMILQPFVRNMITGSTPIYLVTKPSPGTGGSKLIDIYSLIAHGERAKATSETKSEEEFRKSITSVMREGRHTWYLDNVNARVDSSALASVVTTDVWVDRLLGTSSQVEAPVRCTFIVVGNNPKLSNEIARRCVRIRLDAKIENPANRPPESFKIPKLESFIKENRSQILWSCFVLIQNWIAKGRPQTPKSLGSFESWAEVMGGILSAANIQGFLGNLVEMKSDADEEGEAVKLYLTTWWCELNTADASANSLGGIVEDKDIPIPVTANSPRAFNIAVGRYTSKLLGRLFEISVPTTVTYPENAKVNDGYATFLVKIEKGRVSSAQSWRLTPQ